MRSEPEIRAALADLDHVLNKAGPSWLTPAACTNALIMKYTLVWALNPDAVQGRPFTNLLDDIRNRLVQEGLLT